MKLNIGCGKDKREGYLNIDSNKFVRPDKIVNLNKKLSFKDNKFEEVIAFNILEHLEDTIFTLNELYRVCKNRAIIKIKAPHFSSIQAFTDLSHKHPFGLGSLDYVCIDGGELRKLYGYEYGNMKFKIISKKINFGKFYRRWGIEKFANKYPTFWEQRLCYIFPCETLNFKLRVVK